MCFLRKTTPASGGGGGNSQKSIWGDGKADVRLGVQVEASQAEAGRGMPDGVTGRGRSLSKGEWRLQDRFRMLEAI